MRGMKTCQGALEKFWQWQCNRCGRIKPVFALSAFSPASFALIPKGTETTSPTLLCDFCCVAPQQGHTCLHIRTPLGPRRRKHAAHDSRFRSAVQDNFPSPTQNEWNLVNRQGRRCITEGEIWCRPPHICSSALPVFMRVCLCCRDRRQRQSWPALLGGSSLPYYCHVSD